MKRLARRYARAASRWVDDAQLDHLAQCLSALAEAVSSSPRLQEVLAHPVLRRHRQPVLARLLSLLNAPPVANRLLALMERNGRLGLLAPVAAGLVDLADQRMGRQRVWVEAAQPLSPSQAAALSEALSQRLGGNVCLSVRVVPRLIGGWICHVGDVTFDASLHRRIEQITEALLRPKASDLK